MLGRAKKNQSLPAASAAGAQAQIRRYPNANESLWHDDRPCVDQRRGSGRSAQLNLTSAQKQSILQSVASEKGQTAPSGFQAKVGEKVPQSLSMHQLPSSATNQVSAAKSYEYAKLANNEVLLINPKDRQVAEIIMPSSTTGSAR